MLARCRDGPGTDRSSQVYHDIANLRLVPHEQVDDCILGSSHVFSEVPLNADPGMLERDMESRMRLYREYYKKSPTAYPISTGESMILSPIPTEEHRKILAKLRKSHPDPERERTGDSRRKSTSDAKGKETVQVFETKWSDPMIVDWEYCPRYVPDERGYHLRFQSWLEDTIKEKCLVDIFHQAFFNGTAHPDGETSMFVMDMRNYETRLRPDDKEGWAHAHETAAGYCHNVILQNRQVREAEEHRKRMARKAWLQAEARRSQPLPTPSSPKANVYLRPVDVGRDLEALAKIYNWYAYNSATSPDTQALDHDEVRQRVEETINAKLPFIVAVDRGSTSAKRAEKILGYACAREFDGFHRAANSVTAELELYVNNEHLNEGIGKCLLDKLLEVCDPTYTPNCGYIFEARREDRPGYYPGGRRRLARMIFMLCYVDHTDVTDHDRVKKWLEEHAGFEQQGLLRGARVKNHKL
ncbi:hypothetical protein BJX61DRAFT_536308 [Aspergillus egyptiacus]|nr:hypothetical protein BJX61DRAFT_536308 [Aspergillus egyptiacus]